MFSYYHILLLSLKSEALALRLTEAQHNVAQG